MVWSDEAKEIHNEFIRKNSLNNLFSQVMNEYGTVLSEVKSTNNYKHPFRNILGIEIPRKIYDLFNIQPPYILKSSYGRGKWTDVPWMAIFDKRITTSAKKGVYIVYIFNKDTKELFLTLNQGVTAVAQNIPSDSENEVLFTSVSKVKNKEAEEQLRKNADYIRNTLGIKQTIDVKCGSSMYDAGCIWSKKYTLENLPVDNELINDLKDFMELYQRYYESFYIKDEVSNGIEIYDIDSKDEEIKDVTKKEYKQYTKEQFLKEVFISEEDYELLSGLLVNKKNVILQGAPGVGKTFMAKRLAYSILGCEDKKRVQMVQFHQSYSYEDFIVGYRPTENGFKLEYGPFYEFCEQARNDDKPHFFIIDEINRGNLSKIFGELLMLIENDKRGESLKLLYTKEEFSVPENVHIIGMMNTADRSLAIIDYALRRRFAFFDVRPAFDNLKFIEYTAARENERLQRLIAYVKMLNEDIRNDDSLGKGFEVGHSYFCTSPDTQIDKKWIKSTVEYEIIPLINEYWFDDRDKVEEWSKKMRGVEND